MIALFLMLTLMAVIFLFWLPVDNDSTDIVVAQETPVDGLLGLSFEDEDNNSSVDSDRNEGVEDLGHSMGTQENQVLGTLPTDSLDEQSQKIDLLADDVEIRREYEPIDYIGDNITAEELAAVEIDKNGKSSGSNLITGGIKNAPTKELLDVEGYTYDVMGNKRAHLSDYTVRKNDWFAKITGKHWSDLYMWPDLYTLNTGNLRSPNPDLIFPGEKVSIYESLTADGEFSEDDRGTLLSAYLKVYNIYKQLGDSKELASAQLLASAVRYDKDFLERYSDIIAPKDRRLAQSLIKEQKFLD